MPEIGALYIRLAANLAEFHDGLQAVDKRLARLANSVGAFASRFAPVGAAAGVVAAAFGALTRQAIEQADALGKLAQESGISVEQLSRLTYAAELSGGSAETLGKSLVHLVRAIQESKTPTSDAARAFAALGISAFDASGKARDIATIFNEIADKFAASENGANKTAIALALLGREGAKSIPLLNQGAAGLQALGEEADRLGRTVSTKTAAEAERFNDALRAIGAAGQGLATRVSGEILPSLNLLAGGLKGMAEEGAKSESVVRFLGDRMNDLARIGAAVAATIEIVTKQLRGNWEEAEKAREKWLDIAEQMRVSRWADPVGDLKPLQLLQGELGKTEMKAMATAEQVKRAQDEFGRKLLESAVMASPLIQSLTDLRNIQDLLMKDQLAYANMAEPTMQTIKAALDAGKISWEQYRQVASDALNIQRQFRLDEFEAAMSRANMSMQERMAVARAALDDGVISFRTYGKTVNDIEKQNRDAMLSTASVLASTLTTAFQKNKGAAIAAALLNTAVGVTRAFSDPSLFYPLNWIQAGLIAAAGVAQIAQIRSTTLEGGGGAAMPAATSGGSGAAADGSASPQRTQRELIVSGIDPSHLYRGSAVIDLLGAINAAVRDGHVLISTRTQGP